jgi:hypothetical protein
MSKKTKAKRKGEEEPAEARTGDAAQRNKDDRTTPSDDRASGVRGD